MHLLNQNKIHQLPVDLSDSKQDALIHFYHTTLSSKKNKVIFKKNMACLLLKGVKEVHTTTENICISNNQVLMLNTGSTLMSETVASNGEYEAILLFFGNDTLLNVCNQLNFKIPENSQSIGIITMHKDSYLNHYIESLQLLKSADDSMHDIKIREFLGYLHAEHKDLFRQLVTQAFKGSKNIKLQQVIEMNMYSGLSLNELAFLCDMSLSSFKRHFFELYEKSPQKYFIDKKMERALHLLGSNRTPSEVSIELGYEHLSAFSYEFKKRMGLAPKQYQVELLKKRIELKS
ncbi:MAG TPA: AraC family transcriptional regulator [Bacteroidia bacterium]